MITSETKAFGVVAGTIFILALSALCGMFFVIQKKNVAYEGQLQARATHRATETEVASLTALVGETATDRDELARYMLTENLVVDFLSRIGNLARARGLTAETRSLAVEPIEGDVVFEHLTLAVAVTGSFESVTQMLSALESLPYQVRVRTITLERASEAKGDMLWNGSYRLSVTKYK